MPTRRTFDKAEFLPNDNSTPHIVPDVLYPAIGGKLLDGTTSHSGNYGTSQTDSRKYYYTDIKGSRPIRDPRIGAYFGSQRHKFKSIQLLEQETATHGKNVYSVDGREWVRAVQEQTLAINNDNHGNYIALKDEDYVEIVGYFNDANFSTYTYSGSVFGYKIDGGSFTSFSGAGTSANTPLGSRYVDASSFLNLSLSVSLGIHTLRIKYDTAGTSKIYAIELIAQDITNAVTRNKIQIPSQTVFSFGSKFTVGGSSAARHYDPFSVKSDGTGWTSPTSGTNTPNSSAAWPSNIDTATSLGLAKWVDGTNYYRPYNGARVVNWVDENGEIKTSVTVMPPNAKSIANSGTLSNAAAKSNGSAPNDNFRPTFETHTADVGVDEDLLSEVAKSYYSREFGNGAANGGTGATYADASMLSGNDTIAYVMDDGLTSFSSDNIERNSSHLSLTLWDANDFIYITFIGTGITVSGDEFFGIRTIAQNLPYGTYILKVVRDSNGKSVYSLDGVSLFTSSETNYGEILEVTFHQPKMPPIPEGACIIADYMLMADFVPINTTITSAGSGLMSKGIRSQALSRDIFADQHEAWSTGYVQFKGSDGNSGHPHGTRLVSTSLATSSTSCRVRLPSFATNFVARAYQFGTRHELYIGSSSQSSNQTVENSPNSSAYYDTWAHLTNAQDLGVYDFGFNGKQGQGLNASALEIATPIHTSHHYKPFETPLLHELIGGDRNIEQTHLICSADGKTWDEVTRDTSYLGKIVLGARADIGSGYIYQDTDVKWDEWRGVNDYLPCHNKDWAIAYDRVICLKDGEYSIVAPILHDGSSRNQLKINGNVVQYMHETAHTDTGTFFLSYNFKRGDYVQIYETVYENVYSNFQIFKM